MNNVCHSAEYHYYSYGIEPPWGAPKKSKDSLVVAYGGVPGESDKEHTANNKSNTVVVAGWYEWHVVSIGGFTRD